MKTNKKPDNVLDIEDFRHDKINTYDGDKGVRVNIRLPASLRSAARIENINISKVLRTALEKILGNRYKKKA